jgi:hypothetical protein
LGAGAISSLGSAIFISSFYNWWLPGFTDLPQVLVYQDQFYPKLLILAIPVFVVIFHPLLLVFDRFFDCSTGGFFDFLTPLESLVFRLQVLEQMQRWFICPDQFRNSK